LAHNIRRARDDYQHLQTKLEELLTGETPEKLPTHEIKKILLFIDSTTTSPKAIRIASTICAIHGSQLEIVFIFSGECYRVAKVEGIKNNQIENYITEIADGEKVNYNKKFLTDPVIDDLQKIIAESGADLFISSCPLHEHPSGVECAIKNSYTPFSDFLLRSTKSPCLLVSPELRDNFSKAGIISMYEQGLLDMLSYFVAIIEDPSSVPVHIISDIPALIRLRKISGLPEDPELVDRLSYHFTNNFQATKQKYSKIARSLKLDFHSSTKNLFDENKKFLRDNSISLCFIAISEHLNTHSDVMFLELIKRNLAEISFFVTKLDIV